MILYAYLALLKFWCYAIQFAVDFLNHMLKKGLSWRTAKEVVDNNIVNISVFCYHFWQPIAYLDPKMKFPDLKWQHKHFVGIAWEHGDPFTYLVWTESDEGGWQKGQELICKVSRPRKSSKDNGTRQTDNSHYASFALIKNSNLLSKADTVKLTKKCTVISCAQDSLTPSKQQCQNTATMGYSSLHGAALQKDEALSLPQNFYPPPNTLDSEEQVEDLGEQM
eukprot:8105134-Ditylum_brightwellii.AAC.2